MTLTAWMSAATGSGRFCPPGLVVGIDDQFAVCGADGAGVRLTIDQIWPLGCLTKLALADLALKLLDLDAPITRWLPYVSSSPTVRQLLTHTAGLPLDLEGALYGTIDSDGVKFYTLNARPSCSTDIVSYSNIGYGWIAYALEQATGQSLGTLLHEFGLEWGDAVDREVVVIADVRSPHSGTWLEPFNSLYWRSLRLPWAGAFGTLPAISRLLRKLDPKVRETRLRVSGGFPQGAYFGFLESGGCLWEDANWGCGIEFRGNKLPHWVTPSASPHSYGLVSSSGICVWQEGDVTITLAGPRTTDGGWLLRQGPRGTALAFELAKHGSNWPTELGVTGADVQRSISAG